MANFGIPKKREPCVDCEADEIYRQTKQARYLDPFENQLDALNVYLVQKEALIEEAVHLVNQNNYTTRLLLHKKADKAQQKFNKLTQKISRLQLDDALQNLLDRGTASMEALNSLKNVYTKLCYKHMHWNEDTYSLEHNARREQFWDRSSPQAQKPKVPSLNIKEHDDLLEKFKTKLVCLLANIEYKVSKLVLQINKNNSKNREILDNLFLQFLTFNQDVQRENTGLMQDNPYVIQANQKAQQLSRAIEYLENLKQNCFVQK